MTKKAKITLTSTEEIENYQHEVDALLLAMAKYMIEDGEDPAEWVESTFVSDKSCIGDFLWFEKDVKALEEELGLFDLKRSDFVIKTAAMLRQMERKN